jgi:hypothetical protein
MIRMGLLGFAAVAATGIARNGERRLVSVGRTIASCMAATVGNAGIEFGNV